MTDPIEIWSSELASLLSSEEAARLRSLLQSQKSNLLSVPGSSERVKRLVFLVRVLNEPSLKADEIQLMEELFRRMGLDPAQYTIQIGGKRREYAADILFHNPELEASFLMAALNYSEADAEDAERAANRRNETTDYPALEGDICPPSPFESEEEDPDPSSTFESEMEDSPEFLALLAATLPKDSPPLFEPVEEPEPKLDNPQTMGDICPPGPDDEP